jgi:hypothetical protein
MKKACPYRLLPVTLNDFRKENSSTKSLAKKVDYSLTADVILPMEK